MPLTNEAPSSVHISGGQRERDPLPEDHPDNHQTVGRSFLINATDLLPVLDAVNAETATVTAPAGFRRLHLGVVQEITNDLKLKRLGYAGTDAVRLAYLADGRFLAAEQALDTAWLSVGREVDRGRCIFVDLVPESTGGLRFDRGGYSNKASAEDAHRMSLDDATEVCHWYAHDDGRVWRAGSPPPAAIPHPDDGAQALSAHAKRAIMRCVRERLESLPSSLWESSPLIFDPDGRCHGSNYPLTPNYVERPRDHYLRVRPVSDDPEYLSLLEHQLDAVRVRVSGEVVVV